MNTLGLTCQAARVTDLSDLSQLPVLSEMARHIEPFLVLGGGSNLVLPAQLQRVVVRVQIKGIELVEQRPDAWVIDVGAGENWHDFVATSVSRGWDGLENLALIPGTVGAAPVQNIGAYGVELDARVESVTAWNIPSARMETFKKEDCGFQYRDSMFKRAGLGQWLIVGVRFCLPRPWKPVIGYPDLLRHPILAGTAPEAMRAQQIFQAVCDIRRTKLPDPAVLGNAGSFFKNPVVTEFQFSALKIRFADIVSYPQAGGGYKLAAGWLIERCGWKGKRVGNVGVHERQALVLVNYGQATAEELLDLAMAIQQSVLEMYGVQLEIEPVVVYDADS
jgi:UDP-N-acetylmuramate dehydrogenase